MKKKKKNTKKWSLTLFNSSEPVGSICYPKSHWTEWEKPTAYCTDGGERAGR